jgi:hypothetical protein
MNNAIKKAASDMTMSIYNGLQSMFSERIMVEEEALAKIPRFRIIKRLRKRNWINGIIYSKDMNRKMFESIAKAGSKMEIRKVEQ